VAQREYQRIAFPWLFRGKPAPFADVVIEESDRDQQGSAGWHEPNRRTPQRVTPRAAVRTTPDLQPFLRRMFDALCAAAGLVILAPLFAMIALTIKLDDGGPVLYSHLRVGRGLRPFRFLKFRSMRCCSAEGSPVTAPRDPRVTRVGRVLRKYKLDELPQLVNVLKGDMRFVGVRPQLEKHVELFRIEYGELLQSAPGITDLATLTFRNEERFFQEGSIEEQYIKKIMPIKLQLALKYSRTRTIRSDLEIIFRTVLGLGAPSAVWRDAGIEPAMQALARNPSRNSS